MHNGTERGMTDLAEAILFILQLTETNLSKLEILERLPAPAPALARVHETLLRLHAQASVSRDAAGKYAITAIGSTALQHDWNNVVKTLYSNAQ